MILIATQCFAPDVGGIENLMTGLAEALFQRGHAVRVCADRRRAESPDRAFPFPVRRFRGPRPLRRRNKARHIRRLIQRCDGDARVICDSWKSLEGLALSPETTVLCLVHGMEIPCYPSDGKRRRISKSLAKATHVIANSRYTAERVRPYLTDTTTLHIIHPGVDEPAAPDTALFDVMKQQLAGLQPLLVSVARLEPHKGVDRVLQCLPRLRQEFPDLGYVCLGEGPLRASLERLTRDLDLRDCVHLPGRADPATRNAVLSLGDLFVLPGRSTGDRIEGFGIAFIEAAWQGLPAVAGESGGGGEAVEHGVTGLVCRGEDAEAVYAAIRGLLSDTEKRRQMGKKARERAHRFNWEHTVRRYEALLNL